MRILSSFCAFLVLGSRGSCLETLFVFSYCHFRTTNLGLPSWMPRFPTISLTHSQPLSSLFMWSSHESPQKLLVSRPFIIQCTLDPWSTSAWQSFSAALPLFHPFNYEFSWLLATMFQLWDLVIWSPCPTNPIQKLKEDRLSLIVEIPLSYSIGFFFGEDLASFNFTSKGSWLAIVSFSSIMNNISIRYHF